MAATGGQQGGVGRGLIALATSGLPFALALGVALLMQFVVRDRLGDFYAKVALDVGTSVILAVSLTMVNGFTGQFSMGHAAFMLVGAYVAATLVYYGSFRLYGDAGVHGGAISTMLDPGRREGPLPWATGADLLFLAAALAGGLASAACGYLVGLPSLRLKGDYLAIVTLGFGEIVRVIIQSQTSNTLAVGDEVTQEHLGAIAAWHGAAEYDSISAAMINQVPAHQWARFVGGSLGFTGLPFYTNLFWVFLFAGLTLVVAHRLKSSSYGRAFLSIREDEIASEAMGVDTTRYKVRAFVVSAFFAGVAGALFAHTSGVQLNPGELGFQKSFDIIIMVVLGGLGSISGAAIAAAVLTYLPEWLRDPSHVWPLGGVVLLVVAVLARKSRVKGVLVVAAATGLLELGRYLARRNGVELSQYRMVLYALLLILMMILRPQGLLGVREVWEREFWGPLLGGRGGAKGGAP